MASVSNTELETCAKIIMQTKPYKSGKLDLTGLLDTYIRHIYSEGPFDVGLESVVALTSQKPTILRLV